MSRPYVVAPQDAVSALSPSGAESIPTFAGRAPH